MQNKLPIIINTKSYIIRLCIKNDQIMVSLKSVIISIIFKAASRDLFSFLEEVGTFCYQINIPIKRLVGNKSVAFKAHPDKSI